MRSGIKSKKRIQELLREGNVFKAKGLKINWLPSEQDEIHIAISISKKLGNAVVRNRCKRRIRESIRMKLESPVDMLVRTESVSINFGDMVHQAGMLNERVYDKIHHKAVSKNV